MLIVAPDYKASGSAVSSYYSRFDSSAEAINNL
ncbi:hypothetical protein GKR41_00241 [Candidatus Vallotia lariciata]|nr:hypothetical protein GKR41_00241 [Candidatus Vallotia lariciata]